MGDGPFMRGFALRESIKGGTADQGICPLSEGQIPFLLGSAGNPSKGVGEGAIATDKESPQARARGAVGKPPEKGLIDMAELRMTADAETATPAAAKRTVAAQDKKGLGIQDLILVAVLLAAGAVLKLTVGSLLASFGMKPNFIIAAYCLAIIIIRPNVAQSLVIGLIAGLVCQIPMLNATPLLNIPSELLGALACGLLIHVPMKIGKLDVNPLVNTFISTCVSGFTFAALSVYINVVSVGGDFAVAMAAYVAIVLGTATFNCIFVEVLATPLKKVLKR